jgi:hypothetical protein
MRDEKRLNGRWLRWVLGSHYEGMFTLGMLLFDTRLSYLNITFFVIVDIKLLLYVYSME